METPEFKLPITNQDLIKKVIDNIYLLPKQQELLNDLVNKEPAFRERLAVIYRAFESASPENKKSAQVLLEKLVSDLEQILEQSS